MEDKSKSNQRQMIVDYLKAHGSATVRELTIELNINSVTKRVSELCKMGIPITSTPETRVNTSGKKTRFVVYRLGNCNDY